MVYVEWAHLVPIFMKLFFLHGKYFYPFYCLANSSILCRASHLCMLLPVLFIHWVNYTCNFHIQKLYNASSQLLDLRTPPFPCASGMQKLVNVWGQLLWNILIGCPSPLHPSYLSDWIPPCSRKKSRHSLLTQQPTVPSFPLPNHAKSRSFSSRKHPAASTSLYNFISILFFSVWYEHNIY